MNSATDFLEICQLAARAGARELLNWRGRFSAREKSAADLVTDADLASQRAIQAILSKHFPDHGFLGEEDPDDNQLQLPYCWIVDPLDGTTNYVHGLPCYAVSVALANNGRLVAGVIVDPIANECFSATQGGGSHLNGTPIAVSSTTQLEDSLVAVSFPPRSDRNSPDVQSFLEILPRCQAVRRSGSAALNLAYVACGRLDAHWAHYIHSWDSAAGVLLVQEAGGVVGSYNREEYQPAQGDYFVACTAELYQQIGVLLH